MQNERYDALMRFFLSQDTEELPKEYRPPIGENAEAQGVGPESGEWITVLKCLKRIRRWRVPPHWSVRDWFDEILAEVSLAVIQAAKDFDHDRGIPYGGFLHRRIMHTALARYRREWSYAIHRISEVAVDDYQTETSADYPSRESVSASLHEALTHLPTSDASLIEGLYWEGKTEARVAESLGISQQAVNKRKRTILRLLDSIIQSLCPQIAPLTDIDSPPR